MKTNLSISDADHLFTIPMEELKPYSGLQTYLKRLVELMEHNMHLPDAMSGLQGMDIVIVVKPLMVLDSSPPTATVLLASSGITNDLTG